MNKKKREIEKLTSQNEELSRELELYRTAELMNRDICAAHMGLRYDVEKSEPCIETSDGRLRSCAYLKAVSNIGGLIYHHAADEDAELFFLGKVAGHGTPASVSAVYIKALLEADTSRYKIGGGSSWINETLFRINDMLLEKKIRGMFAAMNVLLVWKDSGNTFLWSAGGNPLYRFRPAESDVRLFEPAQHPALGVFHSDMLQSTPLPGGDDAGQSGTDTAQEGRSGFGPQKLQLKEGDYLVVLGEGFDKSARPSKPHARAKNHAQAASGPAPAGESPGDFYTGNSVEELFGRERAKAVMHAALDGSSATIPAGADSQNGEWVLNFDGFEADPEKVLLCAAGAEKLFRMSKKNGDSPPSKKTAAKAADGQASNTDAGSDEPFMSEEMRVFLQEVLEHGLERDNEGNPALEKYSEYPLRFDLYGLSMRYGGPS